MTFTSVEPVTAPDVARIVALPTATAEIAPDKSTAATVASSEPQATVPVTSAVEPSLKVPVAVSLGPIVPNSTLTGDGVTARDTSIGGRAFTVSEVCPETLPTDTVIVTLPAVNSVARPFEPLALLIVATADDDDDQVAELVSD
jgi:hypothetical protein